MLLPRYEHAETLQAKENLEKVGVQSWAHMRQSDTIANQKNYGLSQYR